MPGDRWPLGAPSDLSELRGGTAAVTARGNGTRPSTHARMGTILRSLEPGADWSWCVIDELTFVLEPR
jgi:hypothetical protein